MKRKGLLWLDPYEAQVSTALLIRLEKEQSEKDAAWEKLIREAKPPLKWRVIRKAS